MTDFLDTFQPETAATRAQCQVLRWLCVAATAPPTLASATWTRQRARTHASPLSTEAAAVSGWQLGINMIKFSKTKSFSNPKPWHPIPILDLCHNLDLDSLFVLEVQLISPYVFHVPRVGCLVSLLDVDCIERLCQSLQEVCIKYIGNSMLS